MSKKKETIATSSLLWLLKQVIFLLEIIDVGKFVCHFTLTEWLFFPTFTDKGDLLNAQEKKKKKEKGEEDKYLKIKKKSRWFFMWFF